MIPAISTARMPAVPRRIRFRRLALGSGKDNTLSGAILSGAAVDDFPGLGSAAGRLPPAAAVFHASADLEAEMTSVRPPDDVPDAGPAPAPEDGRDDAAGALVPAL